MRDFVTRDGGHRTTRKGARSLSPLSDDSRIGVASSADDTTGDGPEGKQAADLQTRPCRHLIGGVIDPDVLAEKRLSTAELEALVDDWVRNG